MGRDVGKGGKESEGSRWRHLREQPVSGNGLEYQQRPLRPTDVWNVKTQENLESFRRQGTLGRGEWAAISKGPRGIPGKLGLCELLMAPEPGADHSCCLAGPQTKAPNGPPSPRWTPGVCGMGCAMKAHRYTGFYPGSQLGKRPGTTRTSKHLIYIHRGKTTSLYQKS